MFVKDSQYVLGFYFCKCMFPKRKHLSNGPSVGNSDIMKEYIGNNKHVA